MIRLAEEQDVTAIVSMTRDVHVAARLDRWGEWLAEAWESHVRGSMSQGLCFVAERDKRVIGFVTAFELPAYWNPEVIVLQECVIWVDPAERKSGAGRQLVTALVNEGEARSVACVAMGTQRWMTPDGAERVFTSAGFEPAETAYVRGVTCHG